MSAALARLAGGAIGARGALRTAALLVAVSLGVGASGAQANTFGSAIADLVGNRAGEFSNPRDVAIFHGNTASSADDRIGVVEQGDSSSGSTAVNGNRVQILDGAGGFELMLGRDVLATGGSVGEACVVALECQTPPTTRGSGKGEFHVPTGIAFDQGNGAFYVYDRNNLRVQKFAADGTFLLMFGSGVNDTPGTPSPDVCTAADAVCGAGTAGVGPGQLGGTTSLFPKLAVDPLTGDVLVADPVNRRIQRFNSDGTFDLVIGSSANFAASQPVHLAVDSVGVVYASDANPLTSAQRVNRYDQSAGAFLTPIGSPPLLSSGTTPTVGLTVDPDSDGAGADLDRLYAVRDPGSGNTVVQQIDAPAVASPAIAATHPFAALPALGGVAVNPSTGSIYMPISLSSLNFPACGRCAGLAVLGNDGSDPPTATTSGATGPEAHQATLTGTVVPNGAAVSYQFEYSADGAVWTPVDVPRYVSGTSPVAVSRLLTGLAAGSDYRVRLKAKRYASLSTALAVTSAEAGFQTDDAPPDVTTLDATATSPTATTLQGRLNANGSATTYFFEYGTTTGFGRRAPAIDASAGAGGADKAISQAVSGLGPDTTYHYRLVAENAFGTASGATKTFTTRPSAVSPASRAYELVSPAVKPTGPGVGGHASNSALDGDANVFAASPSVDGDRVISSATSGPVLVPGAAVYVHNYALADRGDAGWANTSPHTRPNLGDPQIAFLDLISTSDDLSTTAWFNSGGQADLFPDMPLGQPTYLRDWDGKWESFAPSAQSIGGGTPNVFVAGGGGHAVLSSTTVRGLAGAGDPSVDQMADTSATYIDDISAGLSDTFPGAGQRSLVGVCTGTGALRTEIPARDASGKQGAQACPDLAPGSGRDAVLISTRGASIYSHGNQLASLNNVVSADGSRVFFMSPDPAATGALNPCSGVGGATTCPAQLYVRALDAAGEPVVRWISRTQVAGQDAALMGNAIFEAASADGDKVFFRTASPLTADDPNGAAAPTPGGVTTGQASNSSWDLYMYDFPDAPGADPGAGVLTRVSAGPTGTADPQVRDGAGGPSVRFLSEDGSRAYFATAGPIPGVAGPTNGTITSAGGGATNTATANLYLYDSGEPSPERWRFVAALPATGASVNISDPLAGCAASGGQPGASRATEFQGGGGGIGWYYEIDSGRNCVRGTADGELLTFWTDGRLVADDPDAQSGDVYAFDAGADELSRISAPQGGAGGSYACGAGGVSCFGDPGFHANGPIMESQLGVATDPTTGAKAAFFQSRSRLTPDDVDDHMDVYEWREGRLSLLSTGITETNAYYSGNSESGRDVFLVTDARLTWQDIDGVRDVYDARIGGGFTEPQPPVACAVLVDGCQASGPAAAAGVAAQTRGPLATDAGDAVQAPRGEVSLRALTARERASLGRGRTVSLRVRVNRPGRVTVTGRGRVRGRARTVLSAKRRASRAGAVRIPVRLSRPGRKALGRAGASLRVALSVRLADASEAATLSFRLRAAGAGSRRAATSKRGGRRR